MVEAHHTPVMVPEVLAGLPVRPGGAYIDCTVGEGGHALALLGAVSDSRLLGIDLDAEALGAARRRLDAYGRRVTLVRGNFADLDDIATEHGFKPAAGVLMDLGMSSLQVDTAARGFSFRQEARLDMRFDRDQATSAHTVVNGYPERSLADIIFRLGEEPRAHQVARAMVRSRPVETTTQLAKVVARALGRTGGRGLNPATRTFQAIRMAVNQELENLRRGLEQAIGVLAVGGRLVVISYHSLEDRLVKSTMRREASGCLCPPRTPLCVCGHVAIIRLINRRVIAPAAAEVRANPRGRSARMRIAERI